MYVYKGTAESRVANVVIGAISQAAQSRTVDEGGEAPVSPRGPLCAIFLRKPSSVPTFASESKRGPFVSEVEKRDEKRFETALWR